MTERPPFLQAMFDDEQPPEGYSRWRADSAGVIWFRRDDSPIIRGIPEGDLDLPPSDARRRPMPPPKKPTVLQTIFGIPWWGKSNE